MGETTASTIRRRRGRSVDSPDPQTATNPTSVPTSKDDSTLTSQALAAKKAENKLAKLKERLFYGLLMIFGFFFIVYLGHGWITLMVAAMEMRIFYELLKVRYNDYRAQSIANAVPLFRTIQWSWFLLAMFFTYGEAAIVYALMGDRRQRYKGVEVWLESLIGLHLSSTDVLISNALRLHKFLTFGLYSLVFVLTVLSFRKDVIKYQFTQLTWTLMTTALVSAQMNLAIYNILEGMFWFLLPPSLVVCNDCFAYFCGMSMSGKIFKNSHGERMKFLPFLSPNKSWEGFVGAFFFTCIFGFAIFPVVYNIDWFVCPLAELPIGKQGSRVYTCEKPRLFLPVDYMPLNFRTLRKMFGDEWFGATYTIQLLPVQFHSFYLSIFASSVAPFGGFFASAIKRAYGIKDFDSFIPGHGGLTDRLDCQLIMTACTYVYFQTFVKPYMPKRLVQDIVASIAVLKPEAQEAIYKEVGQLLGKS